MYIDLSLLYSFFIDPFAMKHIEEESITISVGNYILNENSPLFTKSKLEFNNEYVKNKNDILKHLFEIRTVFIFNFVENEKLKKLFV